MVTDAEALQKAKDIAGHIRLVQDRLYTENPDQVHQELDRLMLDLLKENYPELVEFRMKLKLWYG
jgi:hypothetical protein